MSEISMSTHGGDHGRHFDTEHYERLRQAFTALAYPEPRPTFLAGPLATLLMVSSVAMIVLVLGWIVSIPAI